MPKEASRSSGVRGFDDLARIAIVLNVDLVMLMFDPGGTSVKHLKDRTKCMGIIRRNKMSKGRSQEGRNPKPIHRRRLVTQFLSLAPS